jgi:CheY-like chemotaxis protein
VHGIVESAQGRIEVESELDAGSKFAIELPIAHENVTERRGTEQAPAGSGERILYVDDDDAVVFLIERTLKQLGYDVAGYTDGAAAVRAFATASERFDVVVTDLSMPGITGFDVARAVKRANESTPIVLTSGFVRPQDREQALALGIEHVIAKPDTIEELGQVLDTLCKRLRAQRVATHAN